MSNDQCPQWELSYYLNLMPWDGQMMRFYPDKARAELESVCKAGLKIIGAGGINLTERFDFDLAAAVPQVRGWIDELGLRLSSFHYAGPTYQPLAGGQEQTREVLAKSLEMFAQWSPKAFVIHPDWILGTGSIEGVKQGFATEAQLHGRDAVVGAIADNLRYMARLAAKHDIRLALENLGPFCSFRTPQSLVDLVDLINEPNVGFCLDSGHAHAFGENVLEWIDLVKGRLFETHFHDNRAISMDEHLPVGFGTIPWVDVIRSLRRTGFEGPVTFETGPWPIEDGGEAFKHGIAYWRACESLACNVKPRPENKG